MTTEEMDRDLDRLITMTMSKWAKSLSHPQEAEILSTIHRWNNEGIFVPEVIITNTGEDLPHVIAMMVDAITEKGNAQND